MGWCCYFSPQPPSRIVRGVMTRPPRAKVRRRLLDSWAAELVESSPGRDGLGSCGPAGAVVPSILWPPPRAGCYKMVTSTRPPLRLA